MSYCLTRISREKDVLSYLGCRGGLSHQVGILFAWYQLDAMPGDVMRTKGFTLIELMIVATILGVLLAIAFPAYHDYTIRVRVAEGLEKASFAKLAVAEKILIDNILPANQADTGYTSTAPTINVASIAIGNQGIITITYTANAGNGTITMVPTLDATGRILTWDCTGGTLISKYRPAYCRP